MIGPHTTHIDKRCPQLGQLQGVGGALLIVLVRIGLRSFVCGFRGVQGCVRKPSGHVEGALSADPALHAHRCTRTRAQAVHSAVSAVHVRAVQRHCACLHGGDCMRACERNAAMGAAWAPTPTLCCRGWGWPAAAPTPRAHCPKPARCGLALASASFCSNSFFIAAGACSQPAS